MNEIVEKSGIKASPENLKTYQDRSIRIMNELKHLPAQPPRAYLILRGLQEGMQQVMRILQDIPERELNTIRSSEIEARAAQIGVKLEDERDGVPNYRVPEVIIVGTLPRGQVNASVFATEDPDVAVVIFEFGLVKFISHIAAVLARIMSRPEIDRQLETGLDFDDAADVVFSEKTAFRYFAEFVAQYLKDGRVDRSASVNLAGDAYHLAMQVRLATEYFFLGHEYGHLIKGHLGTLQARTIKRRSGGGHLIVQEMRVSYQEEHEADTWGLTLGGAAAEIFANLQKPRCYVGATLFVMIDHLFQRSVNIAMGRDVDEWLSASHPPPIARLCYICDRLRLMFPPHAAKTAISYADAVSKIFHVFMLGWEGILVNDLLPKGYQIARHWREPWVDA